VTALACVGRRSLYRILVEKPEGKRLVGRPRHRRKVIIKMDHQGVECGDME